MGQGHIVVERPAYVALVEEADDVEQPYHIFHFGAGANTAEFADEQRSLVACGEFQGSSPGAPHCLAIPVLSFVEIGIMVCFLVRQPGPFLHVEIAGVVPVETVPGVGVAGGFEAIEGRGVGVFDGIDYDGFRCIDLAYHVGDAL